MEPHQDSGAGSSVNPPPSFHPKCYSVPSEFLVKDAVLDLDSQATSPESRAKNALLDLRYNAVAVDGPYGTGKTTLMLTLCCDRDVMSKFADAIWVFNAADMVDNFLLELSSFVKAMFPSTFYSAFRRLCADHLKWDLAMIRLVEKLREKRVLVVFDNVGDCCDDVGILVRYMIRELRGGPSSAKILLCTGREELEYIADFVAVIEVPVLEVQGDAARLILLQNVYGGEQSIPSETEMAKSKQEVTDTLAICGGLPLCLVMMGRAVRLLMGEVTESLGPDEAWRISSNIVRSNQNDDDLAETGNSHIFKTVKCCLVVLGRDWPPTSGASASMIVEAFSVVDRRMRIPSHVLGGIFGITDEAGCLLLKQIAKVLPLTNIVSSTRNVLEVEVPKGIYNYSRIVTGRRVYYSRWHKNVIKTIAGHIFTEDRRGGKNYTRIDPRWLRKREHIYVRENLIRHLLACDKLTFAIELICDYRWFGNYEHGKDNRVFQSVLEDFKALLSYGNRICNPAYHRIEDLASAHKFESLFTEIQFIRDALLDCSSFCADTPQQRAFILYGRLYAVVGNIGLPAIVSLSILKYQRSQWIQPASGMVRRAGNMLKRIFPIGISIQKIAHGPSRDDITVGGSLGEILVIDKDLGYSKYSLDGHKEWISGLEIHPLNKEVFSSSWDGSIRVWKGEHQVREFFPFQDDMMRHNDVSCMVLIPTQSRIACGSESGIVRLIDSQSGIALLDLRGLSGNVWDLQASADGKHIASGSSDGTCCIWHSPEGSALPAEQPEVLTTDARGEQRFQFSRRCMDGKLQLLRAGCDMEPLHLHTISGNATAEMARAFAVASIGRIEAVSFNGSADVLFTASCHGDIRAWATTQRKCISFNTPLWETRCLGSLEYHEGAVTSLAVSEDGQELLSGSEDGIACVWVMPDRFFDSSTHNITAKEQEEDIEYRTQDSSSDDDVLHWQENYNVFRNHEINAFAVSRNGRKVLTLHNDDSLRWWTCVPRNGKVVFNAQDFSCFVHPAVITPLVGEHICAFVSDDGGVFAFATNSHIVFCMRQLGEVPINWIGTLDANAAGSNNEGFFSERLYLDSLGKELTLVQRSKGPYSRWLRWNIGNVRAANGERMYGTMPEPIVSMDRFVDERGRSMVYMKKHGHLEDHTYGREVFGKDLAEPIAVLDVDITEYAFSCSEWSEEVDLKSYSTLWALTHSGNLYVMRYFRSGAGGTASGRKIASAIRKKIESFEEDLKQDMQWSSPFLFIEEQ